MAASRLDRFKAALQDDIEKLPNKPEVTPTSGTTQASTQNANGERILDGNQREAQSTKSNGARPASGNAMDEFNVPSNAFEQLAITDDVGLDSDDSEAGCPLEIIPVDAHESEDKQTNEEQEKEERLRAVHIPKDQEQAKMRRGQAANHGEAFCPILAVSKYPYKFVPGASMQAVASAFFDKGQFWTRGWETFYIWPLEPADKPIILVRENQFVQLLKEISSKFKPLHIKPNDSYFRSLSLVIDSFPDHPRMLPRYLGYCKSKDDYDALIFNAPRQRPYHFHGEAEPDRAPTDEQFTDFNDICEAAIEVAKNKPKSGRRQEHRVQIQANLSDQLLRAQCYLGLRDSTRASGLADLEVSEPSPYSFEDDVVIICVDVEAWERSNSIITEVGIATLDTRDLHDIPPGGCGAAWRKKIRARHFRIREHMMYENHEFVHGAADRFEKDFGVSEIIDLKDAPRIVASCFKEPFSAPLDGGKTPSAQEGTHTEGNDESGTEEKRRIIFLGHNPSADIQFLHKLGYDPLNLSNLHETMDTAGLWRAHKKEPNPRGVGNILGELDVVGWNLHNAGNDAVYTLWIFLATAVNEACAAAKENTPSTSADQAATSKIGPGERMADLKSKSADVEQYNTW